MMEFCYKCDDGVARCLQWTITTWRQLLLFEQTDAGWPVGAKYSFFVIINLSFLMEGSPRIFVYEESSSLKAMMMFT